MGETIHTHQSELEQGVRLHLVKRSFQETLFLQVIVVVVLADGTNLLSLFVQEIQVRSAFIFEVFDILLIIRPISFTAPFSLLIVIIVVVIIKLEFFFFLGFFPVCDS